MVWVIVPNYNHAAYLKERIDSILNQTYENFELIILDDLSTDNSKEVINGYKNHSKVSHIIYNEKNSGSVFKQWKKGIELAKGDYIWIAESDDFAEPRFLEALAPLLEADTSAGLAYCDSRFIVDGKKTDLTFASVKNKRFNNNKWSDDYIRNGHVEIQENLISQCTVNNASAAVFRRSALVSVNPFDIEFKFVGDWYAYLKLCMQYNIIYVNKIYNNYRQHTSNASKSSLKDHMFVREFFYLFNWASKNINFVPNEVIVQNFLNETPHTLLRNWNEKRIVLYKHLFRLNPGMFFRMLKYNAVRPFKK